MKYIDVSGIKLNHIRIFLAVAEYGSFTVAAEKLHMTQPFISKSIASLESWLGLYLFVRGNRKFQITPAGQRLYQEWKFMMHGFENSLTAAHAIQSGLTDTLQVGLGQLTREDNILIQNLKKTKDKLPGLEIIVEYNDMASLLGTLVNGMADLIVISRHLLPAVEKFHLEWQTIIESCLAVYMPADHPLACREKIRFEDLRQEKFIVFSCEDDDSYMRLLQKLASEAGFIPMISCCVPNEMSFKANLELGNGIVLADSFGELENNHIKRFDLDIPNGIIAVWKPGNHKKGIKTFLECFAHVPGLN